MKFVLKKYHKNITDDELLADLKEVANHLKKETLEYREYSKSKINKFASNTISKRFSGWNNALEKAGLKVINRTNISDNELLNDLKRVYQEIQPKKLTQDIYKKEGKFAAYTINTRFGWNNALKKIGLELSNKQNISEAELFENLKEVWIKLGKQPGKRDMTRTLSNYSERPYLNKFGSWQKALEAFIDFINKDEDEYLTAELEIKNNPSNKSQSKNIISHKTKRDINLRLRFLVMRRDNFKCVICGRSPATDPNIILHVDHIKAWDNGGETIIENLQTLCSDDNLGKSNLDMYIE